MSTTNILILGATGFIGGTILSQFLSHPEFSKSNITLLARSEDKANKTQDLNLGDNVKVVVGSVTDVVLLEKLASEADVLIQAARPHEIHLIEAMLNAMLAGLKQRHKTTGKVPRLLYVGGTALLSNDSPQVYTDLEPSAFFDPPNPVFRFFTSITNGLVKADQEGYVKTYLVVASFVFGHPADKQGLVKNGIQIGHCFVWDFLIQPALARNKAGYIGDGANVGGAVHIEDLADLFVAILDNEVKAGHGKDGFYFASPIEFNYKEVAGPIGEGLVALGKTEDPSPSAFTDEETKQFFPPPMDAVFGSNNRCKGERSAALGWEPKYDKADFLENAKEETVRSGKGSSGH